MQSDGQAFKHLKTVALLLHKLLFLKRSCGINSINVKQTLLHSTRLAVFLRTAQSKGSVTLNH